MLLRILLVFAVSLIGWNAHAQMDCSSLKEGQFYSILHGKIIKIERAKRTQIETNEEVGLYMKLKVKWTSDCVYILKFQKSTLNGKKSETPLKRIEVTILEVNEDYYVCSTKYLDGDREGDTIKSKIYFDKE